MAQKNTEIKLNIGVINVIAIVILVGLVGLGGHFLGKGLTKSEVTAPEVAAVQSIAYDGVDGKVALDLLKEVATVKTQDSSIGVFVTSINGIENSTDHYWMFYVNGELAPLGADQYQSKSTDKIEWRYDQLQ